MQIVRAAIVLLLLGVAAANGHSERRLSDWVPANFVDLAEKSTSHSPFSKLRLPACFLEEFLVIYKEASSRVECIVGDVVIDVPRKTLDEIPLSVDISVSPLSFHSENAGDLCAYLMTVHEVLHRVRGKLSGRLGNTLKSNKEQSCMPHEYQEALHHLAQHHHHLIGNHTNNSAPVQTTNGADKSQQKPSASPQSKGKTQDTKTAGHGKKVLTAQDLLHMDLSRINPNEYDLSHLPNLNSIRFGSMTQPVDLIGSAPATPSKAASTGSSSAANGNSAAANRLLQRMSQQLGPSDSLHQQIADKMAAFMSSSAAKPMTLIPTFLQVSEEEFDKADASASTHSRQGPGAGPGFAMANMYANQIRAPRYETNVYLPLPLLDANQSQHPIRRGPQQVEGSAFRPHQAFIAPRSASVPPPQPPPPLQLPEVQAPDHIQLFLETASAVSGGEAERSRVDEAQPVAQGVYLGDPQSNAALRQLNIDARRVQSSLAQQSARKQLLYQQQLAQQEHEMMMRAASSQRDLRRSALQTHDPAVQAALIGQMVARAPHLDRPDMLTRDQMVQNLEQARRSYPSAAAQSERTPSPFAQTVGGKAIPGIQFQDPQQQEEQHERREEADKEREATAGELWRKLLERGKHPNGTSTGAAAGHSGVARPPRPPMALDQHREYVNDNPYYSTLVNSVEDMVENADAGESPFLDVQPTALLETNERRTPTRRQAWSRGRRAPDGKDAKEGLETVTAQSSSVVSDSIMQELDKGVVRMAVVLRDFIAFKEPCSGLAPAFLETWISLPPSFEVTVGGVKDSCAVTRALNGLAARATRQSSDNVVLNFNHLISGLLEVPSGLFGAWPQSSMSLAGAQAPECVLTAVSSGAGAQNDTEISLSRSVASIPLSLTINGEVTLRKRMVAPSFSLAANNTFDSCMLIAGLQEALASAEDPPENLKGVVSDSLVSIIGIFAHVERAFRLCSNLIGNTKPGELATGSGLKFQLPPPPLKSVFTITADNMLSVCTLSEAMRLANVVE